MTEPIMTLDKAWGWERWIVNNDLYCGKEIYNDGTWSSSGNFHYHPIKHETFYVLKGILKLDIATNIGKGLSIISHILNEGEKITVLPYEKHRFRAISIKSNEPGCTFIEFSTTHKEEDSIRCYYDNKKCEWVDI